MSVVELPEINYHFYHKGVESRPEWAYNQARDDVCVHIGRFMNAMPNTSNANFQSYEGKGNGGSIARLAGFTSDVTVTGAGSKTKAPTLADPSKQWEAWFDLHYKATLFFVPTGEAGNIDLGLSMAEVNSQIREGTAKAVL